VPIKGLTNGVNRGRTPNHFEGLLHLGRRASEGAAAERVLEGTHYAWVDG